MKEGEGSVQKSEVSKEISHSSRLNRGLSVLDFILRIIAALGTFASAIVMGTTNQTLPFGTQSLQFRAEWKDLPMLTFFVIANSVVCGYLVLSLPLSVFNIIRSSTTITRIILIIFDTAMMALANAGACSAASIVYLAHKGNSAANWFAICQQFNNFCERISGALIGSFVAVVLLIIMIVMSAVALSRC
ncbi:hypothetical protein ACFE04_024643 [Oxalis oulophora]